MSNLVEKKSRERFSIDNYEGREFGKLKVLREFKYIPQKRGTKLLLLCQCKCGSEPKFISMINLKNNITRSCGCLHDVSTFKTPENFIGTKFWRWEIIEQDLPEFINSNTEIMCKCECGTIKSVVYHSLKKDSKSCGCLKSELSSKRLTKHGFSKLPEWNIWYKMKQRCYDENNISYPNYGGRGIIVCDRWLDEENGFKNFIEDIGLRPSKDYSIERKNPNGNYEPNNCIWQNRSLQNLNKRKISGRNRYKGVNFRPELTKDCQYEVKFKRKTIGYFKTAEEAARAYDKEFERLYPEAAPYSTNVGLGLLPPKQPKPTSYIKITPRPEFFSPRFL